MLRIPRITKYLLLINIGAFFLTYLVERSVALTTVLGLHFCLAPDFHLYQLLTYMFMHGGFTHLFFNMFALWMFGGVVESTLGERRFLLFYLLCGIGAGLFQEAAQVGEFLVMCREQIPDFHTSELLVVARESSALINMWTTVGASGAIYGVLLAFGMLYPDQHIFIFPLPIPIKARWFVIIYAAIELFAALSTTRDGVAHIAHLGGMVIAFFLIRYWRQHPYGGGMNARFHTFFTQRQAPWHKEKSARQRTTTHSPSNRQADWDYNAREEERQKEIDAILDKIRKNGYDSLTTAEKQTLFDSSRN